MNTAALGGNLPEKRRIVNKQFQRVSFLKANDPVETMNQLKIYPG
jgi:hypothetical protein